MSHRPARRLALFAAAAVTVAMAACAVPATAPAGSDASRHVRADTTTPIDSTALKSGYQNPGGK